jgi:LVIVD repeat
MHFVQKWHFIGMVCLMSCAQSFTQTTTTDYDYELRSTLSFPDQTLANVCGWTAPNGSEYALVGTSKGMVIVDVTNPAAPVQIVQIPGPDNNEREIKTYSHYAYITSEGGGSLQIMNLSGLPETNLTYHNYQGDHDIVGQLKWIQMCSV